MKNILKLTIKKKWYDLILSGEKTEEYREIKAFWIQRLCDEYMYDIHGTGKQAVKDNYRISKFYDFTHVHFFNGGYFSKKVRNAMFECNGITIGLCKPEWSDNADGKHFIIHLGKQL